MLFESHFVEHVFICVSHILVNAFLYLFTTVVR